MRSSSILAASLLTAVCLCAGGLRACYADDVSQPGVVEFFQQASTLDEAGRSDEAIAVLDNAINLHSHAGILYVSRGTMHHRAGRDRSAIADFSRAIELDYDRPTSLTGRAISRYSVGERMGAMEDLNGAIEADPNHGLAYLIRGTIYCDDERLSLALRDLDEAVRLAPCKVAYLGRAVCHLKRSDYRLAFDDADAAARVDPNDPIPVHLRAGIRLKLGESAGALLDFAYGKTLEVREQQAARSGRSNR